MDSNTSIVTLHQEHQFLLVQPPCPDILEQLLSVEHVIASDPQQGGCLEAVPRELYEVATATDSDGDTNTQGIITWAGLEPAVSLLLRKNGYGVQNASRVVSLAEPDLDALQAHGVVDKSVIDLVRHNDRGIVRYGNGVNLAWVIAQVALAYPDRSIVIATATVSEAKGMASALRHYFPNDVGLIRSGRVPSDRKRIVVGNYEALLGGCMDINRRGLLIALDAVEVLGKRGRDVIDEASSARLLGFLPYQTHLPPRDADHVRCFFGFHEAHVPCHGHQPLPVDVIFQGFAHKHDMPIDSGSPVSQRKPVWQNPIRNRQVTRIARGLHGNDIKIVRGIKRAYPALSGRRTNRVGILACNLEHAVALARKLPGWRIATGLGVNTDGMNKANRDLLTKATKLTGNHLPTIFTIAAADQIDPQRIDVLIRADAGTGLPPINSEKLILANGMNRRLLLVDVDDKCHHVLRRWTRKRRRAYRECGWYCPGADPLEQRVMDFLATRPKVS